MWAPVPGIGRLASACMHMCAAFDRGRRARLRCASSLNSMSGAPSSAPPPPLLFVRALGRPLSAPGGAPKASRFRRPGSPHARGRSQIGWRHQQHEVGVLGQRPELQRVRRSGFRRAPMGGQCPWMSAKSTRRRACAGLMGRNVISRTSVGGSRTQARASSRRAAARTATAGMAPARPN